MWLPRYRSQGNRKFPGIRWGRRPDCLRCVSDARCLNPLTQTCAILPSPRSHSPRSWNRLPTALNFPPHGHKPGHASLAQLVEQLTLNQRVEGSSPSGGTSRSTREIRTLRWVGSSGPPRVFLDRGYLGATPAARSGVRPLAGAGDSNPAMVRIQSSVSPAASRATSSAWVMGSVGDPQPNVARRVRAVAKRNGGVRSHATTHVHRWYALAFRWANARRGGLFGDDDNRSVHASQP